MDITAAASLHNGNMSRRVIRPTQHKDQRSHRAGCGCLTACLPTVCARVWLCWSPPCDLSFVHSFVHMVQECADECGDPSSDDGTGVALSLLPLRAGQRAEEKKWLKKIVCRFASHPRTRTPLHVRIVAQSHRQRAAIAVCHPLPLPFPLPVDRRRRRAAAPASARRRVAPALRLPPQPHAAITPSSPHHSIIV